MKKVYSICGMCTVRCPIEASVEGGRIATLQGNSHVPAMAGGLDLWDPVGGAIAYQEHFVAVNKADKK